MEKFQLINKEISKLIWKYNCKYNRIFTNKRSYGRRSKWWVVNVSADTLKKINVEIKKLYPNITLELLIQKRHNHLIVKHIS